MSSPEVSKKRLALAIIDFLNRSVKDGSIVHDDAESIEIATNCIAESFKVDPNDAAAVKDAIGDKSLLDIYNVFEKLKSRTTPTASSTASASAPPPSSGPDQATKDKAEALKSQGNAAIQQKNYSSAIDFYTQALDLIPLNPVYLSNRAAAYSGAKQHDEAVADAEMAVAADPKFAKAWSRLGFAKWALGDARGAMEAYEQGIEAEGNGGSVAMRKGYDTAKRAVEEEEGPLEASRGAGGPGGAGGFPDLGGLANMFGGGGGGGGGGGAGGMPNFAEMMNNPMMQQMASNLMQNPAALNGLMNNPTLRNAMNSAQSGGGMPDFSSLMQDPSVMEMARNIMGGGGAGDPRPGSGPGSGS